MIEGGSLSKERGERERESYCKGEREEVRRDMEKEAIEGGREGGRGRVCV